MNFEYSEKVVQLITRLESFMDAYVYPIERERNEWTHDPANRWQPWPGMEALKAAARAAGLWNLFMPREYGEWSPGLTNLEYAPLAEIMGRISWASEIFNCSAPDTGNMEVLARYGTPAQQDRWLRPLRTARTTSSTAGSGGSPARWIRAAGCSSSLAEP